MSENTRKVKALVLGYVIVFVVVTTIYFIPLAIGSYFLIPAIGQYWFLFVLALGHALVAVAKSE